MAGDVATGAVAAGDGAMGVVATGSAHGRRPDAGRALHRAALVAVLLLAVAVRVAPWLRPHTLLGVLEYDDGVYYAAARSVLHGLVPYRDFTVVHPPLSILLLLPAAALGAVAGDPLGMVAARVEVVLIDGANVWLVYRLAAALCRGGRRPARVGPLAAAALAAVAPGAVAAAHTVLLEPMTTLFALVGAGLLLRRPLSARAAAAGGGCLAAACGVKLFAAVYAVAAAGWLLAVARNRLWPAAAGYAATVLVVFGPLMAIAGPAVVWRDVVVTQATRPSDGGLSVLARTQSLVGAGALPTRAGVALAAGCLLVLCLVAAALAAGGRPAPAPVWFWVAVAAVTAVAFLRAPSYFEHYAAFFAVPLAISVGGVLAAASTARSRLRWPAVAAVLLLVAVGGAGTVRALVQSRRGPDLAAAARQIPRQACVWSDAVSLLVAADRFHVPDRRCPGWLDGRGQNLVWSGGRAAQKDFYPRGFLADARWQAQTLRQIEAAAYLLVRTDPTVMPEWTPALRRYSASHFRMVWRGAGAIPAQLWVRVS